MSTRLNRLIISLTIAISLSAVNAVASTEVCSAVEALSENEMVTQFKADALQEKPLIQKLIQKALSGDSRSAFLLGQRYFKGNSVTQNYERSLTWLLVAGLEDKKLSKRPELKKMTKTFMSLDKSTLDAANELAAALYNTMHKDRIYVRP